MEPNLPSENASLVAEKARLFQQVALLTLCLALLAQIPGIILLLAGDTRPGLAVGAVVTCIYLLLLTQKLPSRLRIHLFQVVTTAFLFTTILSLGFFSPFHALPVFIVSSAFVFLGDKAAFLQFLVCLCPYIATTSLMGTGLWEPSISYEVAISSWPSKFQYLIVTVFSIGLTGFLIRQHTRILKRISAENINLADQVVETEQRFRSIMDKASERIIITNESGVIEFANQGVATSFGYDESDLQGTAVFSLFAERFSRKLHDFLHSHEQTGSTSESFFEDVSALRADGTTFQVSVRCVLAHTANDKDLLLVVYDYAALSVAEVRIKRLYESIQSIDVGLMIINEDAEITFINNYAAAIFSGHAEPAAGMHARDLVDQLSTSGFWSGPTQEKALSVLREVYVSGGISEELSTASGRWLQLNISILSDGGRVVMLIDCTDLFNIQRELVQSAKLASLGEMAASIAHEINQPLNVIKLATGNLLRSVAKEEFDPETFNRRLTRVSSQVERASTIVTQMRIFGRDAKEEDFTADPSICISHCVGMLAGENRLHRVEVLVDEPGPGNQLPIHPIKLEQVLVALMSNARDALVEKRSESDGRRVYISASAKEDGTYLLSVSDNAGGIPPEIIERVMDPFFTTKETGKGTGLGLSVANRIVREAGGKIYVRNIGAGARFTIELPLVEGI